MIGPLDYSTFMDLLPPAILVAVVAYLTRLFGKIIADQNPFSDDRTWGIELGGLMFMIILAQGVVGVGAALYGPHPFSYGTMHIIDAIVVFILYGVVTLANVALSAKFFRIGVPLFNTEVAKKYEVQRTAHAIGKYMPISVVPIILFYVATIEYLSGSVIWMILIGSSILYILIHLAMNFSLKKMQDRIGVDIHFVDTAREPYRNVIILKVNDDNIRLRIADTIVIVNKDEVFKIEMVIPQNRREL